MAEYRFEARFMGVPRDAHKVVRQSLRNRVGVPGSELVRVEKVGLNGRGFVVQVVGREPDSAPRLGSMATRVTLGMHWAQMALEEAHQLGATPVPDPVCCFVRCEVIV